MALTSNPVVTSPNLPLTLLPSYKVSQHHTGPIRTTQDRIPIASASPQSHLQSPLCCDLQFQGLGRWDLRGPLFSCHTSPNKPKTTNERESALLMKGSCLLYKGIENSPVSQETVQENWLTSVVNHQNAPKLKKKKKEGKKRKKGKVTHSSISSLCFRASSLQQTETEHTVQACFSLSNSLKEERNIQVAVDLHFPVPL